MSANDSINLDRFLTEQVYPALYRTLDAAFPEFAWDRKNGHWTATTWPPGFSYAVNDQHSDRLMVYEDAPWWIKVHGHSGVRFLDYVNHGRKPDGAEFPAAVRRLCELASVPFPEQPYSEETWQKVRQRETRRTALDGIIAYAQQALWSPQGEGARAFLHERGFTDADIRALGFGFYASAAEAVIFLREEGCDLQAAKESGLFWEALQGYIIIPWLDAQGYPLTLYGRWAAKTPPAKKPKTIALPGEGTKASPLYFDRARKAGHKQVVVVEGVFDAALLQVHGDTRVVASVGAQLSSLQLETLKHYRVGAVFICGDPDGGGDQGTIANVEALTKAGIPSYVPPRLPDGLDPDEFVLRFGIEGWHAQVAQAISGLRFRVQQLLGTVCPTAPDYERHEAVEHTLHYLAPLQGEWVLLEQEALLHLIAERTGYPLPSLTERVKRRTTRQQQAGKGTVLPSHDKAISSLQEEQTPLVRRVTLRLPSDLHAEPIRYRITSIIPDGMLTVLHAVDKLGKTLLAWEMARAILRQDLFLNTFTTLPGRVVLALLDDPHDLTVQRRDLLGLTDCQDLRIVTPMDANLSDPIVFLKDFRAACGEFKAQFIVLDALYQFAPPGKDSMNDAARMRGVMAEFNTLAETLPAAVVLIAHDKKDGGDVAGSHVIRATAKALLHLTKPKWTNEEEEDDGRRILDVVSKLTGQAKYLLRNQGAGNWTYLGRGDSAHQARVTWAQDKVSSYMTPGVEGTAREIAKALKIRGEDALDALTALEKSGVVHSDLRQLKGKGRSSRVYFRSQVSGNEKTKEKDGNENPPPLEPNKIKGQSPPLFIPPLNHQAGTKRDAAEPCKINGSSEVDDFRSQTQLLSGEKEEADLYEEEIA